MICHRLGTGDVDVIMTVNQELFLISQLEDSPFELVRNYAFHYSFTHVWLLCGEDVLAVEFIDIKPIVGKVTVIHRALAQVFLMVLCSVKLQTILLDYFHKPAVHRKKQIVHI